MLSSDELEQIRAHVEDQRKWKIHGEWLPGCTGASNIQWPPGDPNSWPLAFPVVCWSEAVDDESVGAQAKFIGWAERGEHSTRITHTFWIRSPDDPKAQPLHADASRLLEHIASLTRKLEAQEALGGTLLFSKRKALVEHCASIADEFVALTKERTDLWGEAVRSCAGEIADAIRKRGLSRPTLEED